MSEFEGKVALVTGGNSGLGRATIRRTQIVDMTAAASSDAAKLVRPSRTLTRPSLPPHTHQQCLSQRCQRDDRG